MRTHVVSIRAFLSLAAVVCVAFFSSQEMAGSEKARPVASLTAQDRLNLPASTQVMLQSGKTVTLATLRAEHQARLQRFTSAAALGRTTAGSLVQRPLTNPAQPSRAIASRTGPQGNPAGKGTTVTVDKAGLRAIPAFPPQPTLVPFHLPVSPYPLPKDYVDFCKAANPSLCIYLPPSSAGFSTSANFAVDPDPLIVDKGVCNYDGGVLAGDGSGCMFYYPYSLTVNFMPTGVLTSAVSGCTSPFTYVVDPKGAIQASYPTQASDGTGTKFLYNYGITKPCVVQVWIQPSK